MADAVYGTLAVISTLLYALSYPVIKAIRLVALIVSPFWAIAQFVLLPVTYSIHGILTVALFPFRLRLLERLETIYIYLGIAGLLGCIAGTILHLCFNSLSSALSIDAAAETRGRNKQRSLVEYRAAKRQRNKATWEYASTSTPTRVGSGLRKPPGLLAQAIDEEEDSDF